jgi:hypothetical protein
MLKDVEALHILHEIVACPILLSISPLGYSLTMNWRVTK